MTGNPNQSERQAAARLITGTALTYEGDMHALFDIGGIPDGTYNERLLASINQSLGTSIPDLPGAMQAWAEANGFYNWDSTTIPPGLIPPWVIPDAIWAANFELDQYWLKGGGLLPAASSLLTTTRSSDIHLLDGDNILQTLGINTLPRTDRGLYVNGQFTNLVARLNPTVAQLSAGGGVVDAGGFGGQPNSIEFLGGVSRSAYQLGIAANSVPYAISFLIQMMDWDAPVFSGAADGPGSTFALVLKGNLVASGNILAVHLIDNIWLVSAKGMTNSTGSNSAVGIAQYANNQNRAFRVCGFQCFQSTFLPDALVPGSSDTAGATLFASDIIHVQGVRPSNSQPEPFPGWEAAGLDNAFGGKNIVTIDRLNADESRFIAGAGVDADNLTKLIFDADNRFKLIVRKSGVDEVTLQTGAVASTGDKTIEWQAKPGDYGIEATGVAGDTDSDAETLPTGATTLRIGSDFGALNPLNGWIKELQILKVAA